MHSRTSSKEQPPANSKKSIKVAIAEASNVKMTEITLDQYHQLLRNTIRLDALERNGVEGWGGYDAAFDSIYDDACIEKLPVKFLD